jgi:hypothetical protein
LLGTDDLGRTVGVDAQEIERQPDSVLHLGRFDRACMHALSLAICPENQEKF